MKIKEAKELTTLATRRLVSVAPSTTVTSAIRAMRAAQVHHLAVLKDGNCLGIVSMKDLLRDRSAAWWYGSTKTTTVGEVMRSFIPMVDENTDLQAALRIMIEMGVTAVPLSSNGKLSGLVTGTDMLKALSLLDADRATP